MTAIYTLNRAIQPHAWWLIYIMRAYVGVAAIITSARRSAMEQAELYARGRTQRGPIVTNTLRSRHVEGLAFDVDVHATAPDDVPLEVWEAFGEVGEYLGLKWGGRWSMRDWRHFELP